MVILRSKAKSEYIAKLRKKICKVASKFVIIVPKPLVDSDVLSLEKKYEVVIKENDEPN